MSAQLTITYTPQVLDCHRIYFKNGGDTYCEYLDDTDSVIGQSKQVVIDLSGYITCINPFPEQISCNANPDITGYIQPCCTEPGSTDNRVSFVAEYSNAICTPYTVECPETGCQIILISKSGPNVLYDEDAPFFPPIVTVTSDCGGTGASVYATMTSGGGGGAVINAVVIDNPGFGYCDKSCITVTATPNKDGQAQQLTVSFITSPVECGNFRRRDCLGNAEITNYSLPGNTPIVMCSSEGGLINVNNSTYTFTEITDGSVTCCDCHSYTIYTSLSINMNYTSCNQTIDTVLAVDGETGTTICAVPGSIFPTAPVNYEYILDIVDNGICD